MRLWDSLMYLVGERRAIDAIARSRGALAVGALLVLSASVARNYDGKDLIGEWDALLHGIGVSFGNALVIYSLVYFAALCANAERPRFLSGFLSFLGLFWMTAPMAWLYAVPYEQFQSPVDAIHSNAWTLALVSVWRVALITRALQVIWGAQYWAVLCIVLLFADVAVFIGTQVAPVPMVDFMGGMQQSREETVLAGLNFMVMFFSALVAPVLLIAAIVAHVRFKGKWGVGACDKRMSRAAWLLPAAALLLLAPAVLVMQPEQRLRHEVESLLRSGRVQEGLMLMSRHERKEFPRLWESPPRPKYGELAPTMDEVRSALAVGGQAAWVREMYLERSWEGFASSRSSAGASPREFLAREPGREFGAFDRMVLRFHLERDELLSPEDREALKAMLANQAENDQSP